MNNTHTDKTSPDEVLKRGFWGVATSTHTKQTNSGAVSLLFLYAAGVNRPPENVRGVAQSEEWVLVW